MTQMAQAGNTASAEFAVQYLAAIVESCEDAIISKDTRGIITSWNTGAERLFGYSVDEAIGKPVTMLIPEGRANEEPTILGQILQGKRVEPYETLRRRKDGSPVEISLTVSPIKDSGGRIIGASKIARDITERRRAQEQQALLLKEMSHRIKNLFTLASSIVAMSGRKIGLPEEQTNLICGRLAALSRAHQLTLSDFNFDSSMGQDITLEALLRAVVEPYEDPAQDQARITATGPRVDVSSRTAANFALFLHELATNAAKHGALSVPEGRIAVAWTVQDGTLDLTWSERNGPAIAEPPSWEGFGSQLTRATIERQLGGTIAREWMRQGLTVRLCVLLSRLQA